jgi:DNA/RNA endonuclease YhcR with UshA esterase domain
MKRAFFVLVVVAATLWHAPVHAHHSFGGTYNVDQKITIKGTIVQLTLRSPHSFVYVEVQDASGTPQRWTIEGASAQQFAQQGFDKDAFKVGDPVEIVGNPSRSPNATRARLIRITRTTDGRSWGGGAGEVVN